MDNPRFPILGNLHIYPYVHMSVWRCGTIGDPKFQWLLVDHHFPS